jgi:Asp/Glu/hydantoin racemase
LRLLVINPNTTASMTEAVLEAGRSLVPRDVDLVGATGRFGPRYIASRAGFAVASHAALDAYAQHGEGCDAVLLACFGDPGLDALREVSPIPVAGLVEASIRAASAGGRRFSIVTGGQLWSEMLRENLVIQRHDDLLASIRTVAPDGGTIARDPEGALAVLSAACEDCVRIDGAEAVILAGTGLLGLADRVEQRTAIPVICSVVAGFQHVLAAAGQHKASPSPDRKPVESIGLSEAMTRLLARS